VLVVDDDPEVVRTLRSCLEEEGLAVLSASTAALGASLASDRLPDVIVLDLLLPDRSGLDLLQDLKRHPATERIPVLVLAARGDESDARRGLDLGANRYVSKPFDVRALVAEVRRHVGAQAADGPRRASL